MSNQQIAPVMQIKNFMNSPQVQSKIQEILGKRSSTFTTSVMQIVSSNDLLSQADPKTVFNAAMVAATTNLPINNQLGFAYIVPYKNNKTGVVEAQFQIGYKGLIQLSLRSGQITRISAVPVYDGQLIKADPLRGYEYDFSVPESGKPIGYAAYFRTVNGGEFDAYMHANKVEAHAKKYSMTYKRGFGNWKDNFDAMALKTVLKLLLGTYAPKDTEMQLVMSADQAVVRDIESQEFDYIDNKQEEPIVIEAQGKSAADAALDALSAQENEYATMRG